MNIETGRVYEGDAAKDAVLNGDGMVRWIPKWLREAVRAEIRASKRAAIDLTADTPQAEWARKRLAAAQAKRARKAAKRKASQ